MIDERDLDTGERYGLRIVQAGFLSFGVIVSTRDPIGIPYHLVERDAVRVGWKTARQDGSGRLGAALFALYAVLIFHGDDYLQWLRRVGAAPR